MKRVPILILILAVVPVAWAADRGADRDWWVEAEERAARDGYRLLDTAGMRDALEHTPPVLLVDVRPDYEFAKGHIAGALNMEFGPGDESGVDPDKRRRFEALVGPDKKRPVVFYCRSFW